MYNFIIEGHLVDISGREVYPARIKIREGKIESISRINSAKKVFILPGFIDAHVHIESSMLIPSEFAKVAVIHGTIATVSDPHEIANVLGVKGVNFMIRNGKTVPFYFNFGAPSCVPATPFETAGASLTVKEVRSLLKKPEIKYLSEMMNFPGVLNGDAGVKEKIRSALELGKPVDGHAPGLTGDDAREYIKAGISTDHECTTLDEALFKARNGMKISIREGSAARNFDALIDLIDHYPEMVMFCSDDKHPDSLVEGHINNLVRRAITHGKDLFDVLTAACITPVHHYGLKSGILRPGDAADFIVVDDLTDFNILQVCIKGNMVAEKGESFIKVDPEQPINHFNCSPIRPEDLQIKGEKGKIRVIRAVDGELITREEIKEPRIKNGFVESDPENDILKLVVVNRYSGGKPSVAFISGFGLDRGALASSVAHDSHNIIAVGVSDEEIAKAVNLVIESRGGIAVAHGNENLLLKLPVAGLMSDKDGFYVAKEYIALDRKAKELGATPGAPFMTLSFMALLVIPELKLSDKGLFDGKNFTFTPLFV